MAPIAAVAHAQTLTQTLTQTQTQTFIQTPPQTQLLAHTAAAATQQQQQQQCEKYKYVVTPAGPKIVPVPDVESREEESAADYNAGGYLAIHVGDTFKDGRYIVLRKLGYASPLPPEHFC